MRYPLPGIPARLPTSTALRCAGVASTFVIRPCMMRKCGLLTLSCTEWKRFCTRLQATETWADVSRYSPDSSSGC